MVMFRHFDGWRNYFVEKKMSIYIKGMKMPENGSCIQIVIDDDGKVYPSVEKCI